MSNFQVAFIPIGVPTFHLESANGEFHKSIKTISSITDRCLFPTSPLLTIEDLRRFIDSINPDLIILQNTTFANSAYANEVIKKFSCPILLWTLREPVIDGGRLRLNSLTGAYSAGNLMYSMGKESFEYVFGSPDEKKVIDMLSSTIKAAQIKKLLTNLNIAAIGQTPQGFGFGRALDVEITKVFGANLESIEARELMTKAKSYSPKDYEDLYKESVSKTVGLDKIPDSNVDAFVRLYKAYSDYIQEKNIGAIASRCWPDFFTEYGTPVCAVLGMLNDNGIAASCESDLFGALSMYIGMKLSNSPAFFGDPVSLNEGENTVTYWHCGTAACSLANKETAAQIGVHPNRKIGPTMEFGCKACDEITIFRIGKKPDGTFRFFIAKGKALDKPKQFCGTSVVIETEAKAEVLVNTSVKDGWEPHFAIIYSNVAQELEILGGMLNIEICKY